MNFFTRAEIARLTPKQIRWENHHTGAIKFFAKTLWLSFPGLILFDLQLFGAPRGSTVMEYYFPSLMDSLSGFSVLQLFFLYFVAGIVLISGFFNNYHKYKAFRNKQKELQYFVAFVDYTK